MTCRYDHSFKNKCTTASFNNHPSNETCSHLLLVNQNNAGAHEWEAITTNTNSNACCAYYCRWVSKYPMITTSSRGTMRTAAPHAENSTGALTLTHRGVCVVRKEKIEKDSDDSDTS